MNKSLRFWQWLFFLLGVFFPFVVMVAHAATAMDVVVSDPDFLYTEPQFETLHDAESIDNQPVTALAQDTRGLIWIGTQQGLVRYDGYRFRKFTHKASNPFSIAGNYVNSLSVGKV